MRTNRQSGLSGMNTRIASMIGFTLESVARVTHLPVDDYLGLELSKKSLYCVGFWPADSEPNRAVAAIRRFLPPFLIFMNLYTGLIGYPALVYHTLGVDLQRCLSAAAADFVLFTLFAIYSSLLFRREQIDRISHAMEAMNACRAKLAERPPDVVERNSRWSLLPFGYLLIIMGMIPLGFIDLMGLYGKTEFSYDQWYPFEEKVFPVYQVVFLLTAISHNCALICMVTFTAMFMSLVVEAIGHFRLLSHNLRHIAEACKVLTDESSECSNPQHDVERPTEKLLVNVGRLLAVQSFSEDTQEAEQPFSTPGPSTEDCTVQEEDCTLGEGPVVQLQTELEEALKSCVQHHHAIIRFVEEVACFFDKFLFRYLMCALIPTSMAVVIVIYAKELDPKTKTILAMVLGSNLGMVIICWLANHLTDESEGIRDAVYDCDWFGQSESFKRSMRIIMSHGNQPVVIHVGGLVTLSMETYYEMSKLTYSYSMAVWTQYQEATKQQTEDVQQPG